jgi:hypothetical protein
MGVWLKKWWPTILPVITAAWAVLSPQLRTLIANNVVASVLITHLYAILASLLPSAVMSFTAKGKYTTRMPQD